MSVDLELTRLLADAIELRDRLRAARAAAEGNRKTALRRQANALEQAVKALRTAWPRKS